MIYDNYIKNYLLLLVHMFHASLQTIIHKFTALLIGNYNLIGSRCGTDFMTIHKYKNFRTNYLI